MLPKQKHRESTIDSLSPCHANSSSLYIVASNGSCDSGRVWPFDLEHGGLIVALASDNKYHVAIYDDIRTLSNYEV